MTLRSFFPFLLVAPAMLVFAAPSGRAGEVLVEAEAFSQPGGWRLDTQFIDIMGSPYLIAHGMGVPVADAETTVKFPQAGSYRLWVRTKDWVAQWKAPGEAPGRFQVAIDGRPVATEFGAEGADWHWQDGGTVAIAGTEAKIALHDLTGFDGRCDALLFSSDPAFTPDNSSEVLPAWRRETLGLPKEPIAEGPFDIVFVGGGYAGSCGAISAARMGLKVALIQNRGVLGGNGSSEVRVWAQGNTPPGLYPVGDIVREFEDDAKKSPGTYEEFEDAKKEKIARAEKNLSLFLDHHAYAVEMKDPSHLAAVLAFDTRTGAVRRFEARTYCDATGHGTVGMLANADREMIDGGRMGMSNMWAWETTDSPRTFPETPWALDLAEGEFPYPRDFHAQWFWESGFDKDPLKDLETIRDWNLRASYGAWNAIKNHGAYARSDESGKAHANARMTWLAYIGGPRETQQLLGDIVLTEEDIVDKKPYPDGCVLTTWSVDLHYPQEQYVKKFPDNPFISKAVHGGGVDRKKGYPVPYRCFYSRNIENLFMAGRNISVTHEALGTVRVMKTCGMMGVVVGKAAALCARNDCSPRDVYYQYLEDLIRLCQLPGYMRRDSLDGKFYDDPNLPHLEEPDMGYVPKSSLSGIVIDDSEAKLTGKWAEGAGLKGFIENGYRYAGKGGGASARFEFTVPRDGEYEVRLAWQPHENRATNTPVTVISAGGEKSQTVNQRVAPPLAKGFYTLGAYRFEKGKPGAVVIGT
ncbi:MAG: FAD-dependent oxidoreductase, partial [Verrucomicrobiae bacterium]|nr:FAD-dependent oxidoreductase [Verrucomicrobiae bacterium]